MSVKGKVFAATAVIGVVAAAALMQGDWGYTPNPLTGVRDDVEVVVHVDFEADKGIPHIQVQTVGGPVVYPAGSTGTWERVVSVPPGTRVMLMVSQQTGGNTECSIVHRGDLMDLQGMYGPGVISCQYVAA